MQKSELSTTNGKWKRERHGKDRGSIVQQINYSQWAEVEVVKSPSLDQSFNLLEVPVSITNDRGTPYQSTA